MSKKLFIKAYSPIKFKRWYFNEGINIFDGLTDKEVEIIQFFNKQSVITEILKIEDSNAEQKSKEVVAELEKEEIKVEEEIKNEEINSEEVVKNEPELKKSTKKRKPAKK